TMPEAKARLQALLPSGNGRGVHGPPCMVANRRKNRTSAGTGGFWLENSLWFAVVSMLCAAGKSGSHVTRSIRLDDATRAATLRAVVLSRTLQCARAPEEGAGRRANRNAPPELREARLEVRGSVRDFHRAKGRAVLQAALDRRGRRALDQLLG